MIFSIVQSFDDSILQALVAIRSDALTFVLQMVSFIGEWYILLPIAAIIVFELRRRGFMMQAKQFSYAIFVTFLAVVAIKFLAARPRPPEPLRIVSEVSYSFPSWHAAIAVAFCGYLTYFALKRVRSVPARISIVVLCIAVIAGTAFSRLYLGAHYFSDVGAGLLLGGLVLLVSILSLRERR